MSYFGLFITAVGAGAVWLGYKIHSPSVVAGGTAVTAIGGATTL